MTPFVVHNTNTNTRITNVDAPRPTIDIKWPALIVTGKSVTPDQARDIIFRTHSSEFYSHTDNFTDHVMDTFDVPKNDDNWGRYIPIETRQNYGMLDLQYLNTSRITSCWFGGLSGWIDWDGTIGCADHNIGKWPSIDEVLDELITIATAFPYLEMQVQLLNHESGFAEDVDTVVTVQYDIKDGIVTMFRPADGTAPNVEDTGPISMFRPSCIGIKQFDDEFNLWQEYRKAQISS